MTSPISKIDKESIKKGAAIVKGGGLIVYPTDTVYGLGCDPLNPVAVDRLFEAKKRGGNPVPILCDSRASAEEFVRLSPTAKKLADRHWPGPLTIVAPLKVELPPALHQGTGMLGVRIPGLKSCRDLVKACGGHITGTSANVSGAPPSRTALEAKSQLGGSVELILDGGVLGGQESTVVRIVGRNIEAIRRGPVGVTEIGIKRT